MLPPNYIDDEIDKKWIWNILFDRISGFHIFSPGGLIGHKLKRNRCCLNLNFVAKYFPACPARSPHMEWITYNDDQLNMRGILLSSFFQLPCTYSWLLSRPKYLRPKTRALSRARAPCLYWWDSQRIGDVHRTSVFMESYQPCHAISTHKKRNDQ